ncbi:MAG: polyhydroxyalkanoate synthase [Gammaproteobacteria bacterium]
MPWAVECQRRDAVVLCKQDVGFVFIRGIRCVIHKRIVASVAGQFKPVLEGPGSCSRARTLQWPARVPHKSTPMSDSPKPAFNAADHEAMARTMSEIAERSKKLVEEFVDRYGQDGAGSKSADEQFQALDPALMGRAFGEMCAKWMENPAAVIEAQMKFWQDYAQLWSGATQRARGESADAVIEPEPSDRRFKNAEWDSNPVFDFIKQSYLLTARCIDESVAGTQGLDEHAHDKLSFYARQFVDAMAPTNFAATNPDVMRETLDTGGENLLKGLANLLEDLERGHGKLRVRMTDSERFTLGENVAVTPGKVVFQNDLMQLLQYAPSTPTVFKRPLLIIPPWINKFYILDLSARNSLIKWAVEQGHTVFVISWVNPDATLAGKTFEDYMHEGPLAALDAIKAATGERSAKVIGYCLGGTLLAATLAYMAKKKDTRISCATFLTTMVDFSEPGELGVFIDDEQLESMEKEMHQRGYFDGANMAEAFNLLRANDLIWSFVVNNYLMGKEPFPFDLLFWNSDSTRMPREMHTFYLRKMYQQNMLCKPGGISLDGIAIDLRDVKRPCYIFAAREDHIAPWKSAYSATGLYGGKVRFVLGASGHIAGVVNPPAANKYGYWSNDELPASADEWFGGASAHEGSWWTDWAKWVSPYNGVRIDARQPGDGKLSVVEDAPGSYVKVRLD